MNPEIWGPPFWFIVHTIAIAYPEKNPTFIERRNHYDFFRNLQHVIPCMECRRNYCAHFKKYPIGPFLDNKYSLVQWTIIMHNAVNRVQGRPVKSTKEVLDLYRRVYDDSVTTVAPADRYCQCIPRNAKNAGGDDTVAATNARDGKKMAVRTRVAWAALVVISMAAAITGGVYCWRRGSGSGSGGNNK